METLLNYSVPKVEEGFVRRSDDLEYLYLYGVRKYGIERSITKVEAR
jgi:hypothetical protein